MSKNKSLALTSFIQIALQKHDEVAFMKVSKAVAKMSEARFSIVQYDLRLLH
jgi:hypothetical protein